MRPYVDARKWSSQEKRSVLLRWADGAMLFTASWGPPSTRVQRPDGAYRRKYVVAVQVPSEHRELSFAQLRSAALCLQSDRPAFITEDIEGVVSRDLSSVTIAMWVDDWQ